MSPFPSSVSAPFLSRTVRESVIEMTRNATRDAKFALMTPVMTSTDGRCVAKTRWMPTARAICASRWTGASTSRGALTIRSANSSTTTTMCGRRCLSSSGRPSRSSPSSMRLLKP